MRRVLFVDDETQMLDSLRDALRPRRHEWEMSFAASGEDALDRLEREVYDVIVSDMRMNGMDGATLLGLVELAQPGAVRIVLSGSAERDVVVRAGAVAHRFLAKPCDVDELARLVERSCALRSLPAIATRLPAAPRLHAELTALLRDGGATPADAAAIIERDIAMSAKVLALVNSAWFGLRRRVADVRSAAVYLGLTTLRGLVLSAHAFEGLAPARRIEGFDLDAVQRHCLHVAQVARRLLPYGEQRDDAFTAALLHDVGLLALAAEEGDYLEGVLAQARASGRPLAEIELEERGVTHAEIGAHLLAQWGLPDSIVEAVAYHHRPEALHQPRLDAVAAVAIACALVDDRVDADYIASLGVADRLDQWRSVCAEVVGAPTTR
jgi:putative nucleotidyltransferase with HDIG domain